MKLTWLCLFLVLCNAEQLTNTDVRSHESTDQHDQQTANLDEKHFRLLANQLPQQVSTPLNGKHLRLVVNSLQGISDIKRNSTGHVVQTEGPVPRALDWLSRGYNFTYSYIPIRGPFVVDDLPNQRGGITFLRQGEADLYIGALLPTWERFQVADFSSPWMAGHFVILIPIPNSSTNIGALIDPMSTEVWVCIGLSIPTVIASLFGLSKCIVALNNRMESKKTEKNSNSDSLKIADYVLTVLLSQGGCCERRQLAIRLAAAAWCLACFVLVQAYSSTLIAFITSPNTKPIINSVYDIPNVPGLKITVTRNFGADFLILQSNLSFFKKLGDSLREDSSLRCNKTEICLDKVRSGNHVYIHGHFVVQKIIASDREQTGSCHFTAASESFWPGYLFFFLQKKSLYTETTNRGILRMQETGLLGKWVNEFNPVSTECLTKKKKNDNVNRRISLKNLTSAFILLMFGICVSFLVFVVESIYRFFGIVSIYNACKISYF